MQWLPSPFGLYNLERALELGNFTSDFERYAARCGASKRNEKDYVEVFRAPCVKGFSGRLDRKLRKAKLGSMAMKKETIYTNY